MRQLFPEHDGDREQTDNQRQINPPALFMGYNPYMN
jgi:hypothetical protein